MFCIMLSWSFRSVSAHPASPGERFLGTESLPEILSCFQLLVGLGLEAMVVAESDDTCDSSCSLDMQEMGCTFAVFIFNGPQHVLQVDVWSKNLLCEVKIGCKWVQAGTLTQQIF